HLRAHPADFARRPAGQPGLALSGPPSARAQGWIEAEWKVSELGRRAKYYHLTASGRRQLAVEPGEREHMADAIGRVMKLA
ncbi:MAG TPA: helix-turn-helix transcriptional regulator, partial [Vicinamibacterales bacterium]|nr:helix-turn-helix transcriptional regulator [Vicinamibacterales bacterium]